MANLARYLPRLDFDVRAQFEPVSGLIFLNVDSAAFFKAGTNCLLGTATERDIELTSAINHEWYHYFQTIANGYQYQYASEMWRAVVGLRRDGHSTDHQGDESPQESLWMAHSPEYAKEMLDIDPNFAKRMTGVQDMVKEAEQAKDWERDPPGRDLSVLAAQEPALAQAFDQLWVAATQREAGGLSAMDLIEGSAIVYEHAASRGRDGLEDRLAEVWQVHGETYRRSYDVAKAACGPRALDIILPATALALRYNNPAGAFPGILERLNSSPVGSEMAEARRMAERPPKIDSAGPYLGTACDVREKQRDRCNRYQIYDDVLDDLAQRGSGVDEMDLIADPGALLKLPSFTAEMVATDTPLRGRLDPIELGRRIVLGNLVLRTSKLPRYRRDLDQRLNDRFTPLRYWMIDPRLGAGEYARLACDCWLRRNFEQARLHFETALSLYEFSGEQERISDVCFYLGIVCAERNDRKRAEELYRKSLDFSKRLEDPARIARASGNLGGLCSTRHDPDLDQAELLIREALGIYERLDHKEGIALEHFRLGRIKQQRGNLAESAELLGKALKLYAEIRDTTMTGATKSLLEEVRKAGQG